MDYTNPLSSALHGLDVHEAFVIDVLFEDGTYGVVASPDFHVPPDNQESRREIEAQVADTIMDGLCQRMGKPVVSMCVRSRDGLGPYAAALTIIANQAHSYVYPNKSWPPPCRSMDGNDTLVRLHVDGAPGDILLNRHQVEWLLPMLTSFAKTGRV